ncbi:complement C1q-like protein 4 [Ylistrum balloti]|uniref:complement C1q-like protein 4 n=1 Tax=Ylistrum balloti TaxID=509963 RepID=UPI002905C41A|nr:complement C1q-like protein 4 [Ylistrum balloti]
MVSILILFLLTSLVSSEEHGTIEVLIQRLSRLEETVKEQQYQISNLERQKCDQTEKIHRRVTGNNSPVAFSVYLSHFMSNIAVNHKIPYDVITTNEGSAYENATSTFTCPRAGLYLFMWNVMTDTGGSASVSLRINGVISRWSISGSSSSYYDNAGNQDLVRLEEGDKVWMAFYAAPGELHPHHTTFAGVWLAE